MPVQNLWRTIGINAFLFGTPLLFICIVTGILIINWISPEHPSEYVNKRKNQRIYWLMVGLLLLPTLSAAILVILDFSTLSHIATLLAPDRNVSSFTKEFYQDVKTSLIIAVLLAGALVSALLVFHQWAGRKINHIAALFLQASTVIVRDSKYLLHQISTYHFSSWELWLLAMITLLAAWFRWIHLDGPMHHDEAYTFIAFASRPLSGVVSDYHLPNNHVLHSILVHFSTRLFGIAPWAVRLPAYLSGVVCVPAVYLLSRVIYGRKQAILGASITASLPLLVGLRDARGYTLLGLLTLLVFCLGWYVRRYKNSFAWVLLSLLTALGFYDVPVMLYSAGALFLWLFLSMAVGDFGDGYKNRCQFIKWWLAAGLLTFGLTLIFYMPVIIGSGLKSLIANPFIASQSFDPFFESFITRLPEIWQNWSRGVPAPGWLAGIGLAGAIIFNRRLTNHKIPILLVTFLWISIALLGQRPQVWGRVWVFIVPLLLVWITAGLFAWIDLIKIERMNLSTWVSALAIALILISGIIAASKRVNEIDQTGNVEEVVQFIAPQLQEGDLVLSSITNEPQLWYYFRYYRLPESYLQYDPAKKYDRISVIIYNGEAETPCEIVEKRGIQGQCGAQQNSLDFKVVDGAKIFTVKDDG